MRLNQIKEIDVFDEDFSFLEKETAVRFNVSSQRLKYQCLYQRNHGDYLFVIFHGANDRKKYAPPFFDRWSWHEQFPGRILNFSDPTLLLDETLTLGWYVGTAEEYPLDAISRFVQKISKILMIPSEKIIFWGSSGGGFASLMMATRVSGAVAVAINPQTSVFNYYKNHVNKCMAVAFPGEEDHEVLKAQFIDRFDVGYRFGRHPFSKALIVQNELDQFHFERHFKPLRNKIASHFVKFITYKEPSGHGPERREKVPSIVAEALSVGLSYRKFERFYAEKKYDLAVDLVDKQEVELLDSSICLKFLVSLYALRRFKACYELAIFWLSKYPRGYNFAKYAGLSAAELGESDAALELLRGVRGQLGDKTPSNIVEKIQSLELTIESLMKWRFGFLLLGEEELLRADVLPSEWELRKFSEFSIYLHPETKIRIFHGENEITLMLIGEAFSIDADYDVAACLSAWLKLDDWSMLDRLSGRFALIHLSDSGAFVMNDSFGSRTLFYAIQRKAISSHSSLLAEALGLQEDSRTKEFIASWEYKARGTVYLPGDSTFYSEVKGLAPNNLYDLRAKRTRRYWPREELKTGSIEEFLKCVDRYFEGFSSFISENKYKPVLGLTAGVDSRAVIAGLQYYGCQCKLVTWTRISDEEKIIVEKMAEYLEADHEFIDTKRKVTLGLAQIATKISAINSGYYRGGSQLTGQMLEQLQGEKYLFIRGLGGEILRGFYNRHGKVFSSGSILDLFCKLYVTKKVKEPGEFFSDYVRDSLDGFIDRANYGEFYNYDILDLYYWEQRMGMWAANLLNELDPAMPDFVGLNNRLLYQAAMGLPRDVRLGANLMLMIAARYDVQFSKIGFVS